MRGAGGGERGPADWGALRNWRLVRSAATAFCNQFASSAVMVLAALVAADRFGLSASARGLVVASFGLAGLFTGRFLGRLAERFGVVRVGAVALVVGGTAVAAVGVAPWVAALVALVAAAGVAGTAGRVLTNSLAVASTPGNIGGATSITMATQFVGTALVPALLPLYAGAPVLACVVAGAVSALGAVVATRRVA
jgi:MFS family permease